MEFSQMPSIDNYKNSNFEMEVKTYKEKYERKKYAYDSLSKDYNEIVQNYNGLKGDIINSLKSLKVYDFSDYDVGYNKGIEESIAVVSDMSVPLNFEAEKPSFLLTRLEYELLKYWNKKYKYIARDKDGCLYVYKDRPSKNEDAWCGLYGITRIEKYDFFKFIEWTDEEPMSIEEILNNCEVLEDD